MNRPVKHILLPAIMPLAFTLVASTPVETLGCRNRGLIALAISLASGISGVGAACLALRGSIRRDPGTGWWVATALILAVPVAAMLYLA
jgi:hypothetical protein